VGDVKNDMRDVKARLGSIESYIATLHGDQTRTSTKLDDVMQRVERLEKRTGLVDAR
jgi:phage shock protein A